MDHRGSRVAQLEGEVRALKAQLEQAQESIINMRKSENTFHSIFDHSADGIMLVDSKGIVREWSKGYEQISGLSKESVVGKMYLWEVSELLLPLEKRTKEECKSMKAGLMEVVASMKQKSYLRHIRHIKTGEYRIFDVLYFPVNMSSGITLAGISRDITEKIRSRELLEEKERKLIAEKERLETLSNNLPEGTMYRCVLNLDTGKRYMEYVSGTWERVTGLTPESVAEDMTAFDNIVHPEDLPYLYHINELDSRSLPDYNLELRINKNNKHHWLRISSHPYADGNKVIWDGIMTDITARKEVEAELTKYRMELESLVKDRTEELETTNEELYAANDELEQYRTHLELMVKQKTEEIGAQQKDLEVLSRRQAILIKVLHIMQSAENLPKAINASLAEIGGYTGVSRVYIFEKSAGETIFRCTYEWRNTGITHIIEGLHLSAEVLQPILDIFNSGDIVRMSDIHTLNQELIEILEGVEVKSISCLPLSANGVIYGFVGFDECVACREWEQNEVELLKSLSQIISAATRHYQADTAMRLSQNTMRTVLDNINANIVVIDFETMKILFANKSIKKMVGNENLDGEICWRVLQKDKTDVCDFCPRRQRLNKKGICHNKDICHWEQYNEMTERWYTHASAVIEWVDGRLVQMEVSIDINDRKLAEIELISAKEKAEESDKLKSAFLANVSHEIRTPLNGITGFLHFLSSDDLPSVRKQEYISIINNNSVQLVKLIDDIIDVAKIEAKQLKIIPIPVQINDLMTELQIFFETHLQTNNKEYVAVFLDDSEFLDNCVTLVDQTRLCQVLNNLIDNAIKFTEKGYIRFGYRQSAPDQLEFVVEDTGIGIAAELHEVIFERFRQVELSNSRLYGGTGIGLSIAQNLVQMMGGDIWVKSVVGAGSSFYFTIPYLPVLP